ncbi:MAG: hypothetical protein H6581_29520 [Bacteroidia bacterium]|nr:hypothetical protein [Bacteroidia bacterium]
MKRTLVLLLSLAVTVSLFSQSVKLKDGVVLVDNASVAKIESVKNPDLMLVKDFTVKNMKDEVLFTAKWSDAIPENPNDNTIYYYEFSFVNPAEKAWLPLAKLGTDKSLANLIGKNNLIKANAINAAALKTLISKKGKTPPPRTDYPMVERNRSWPVEIREAGKIQQQSTEVANFTDKGTVGGMDVYEFRVPTGELAAIIKFSGGNNATSFFAETPKDGLKRNVALKRDGTVNQIAAVDRNYFTLKLLAQWLVDNKYI